MENTMTVLPAESYFCGSGKVCLPERPADGGKTVVCRVAIVNPGFPDSVIKISPAEHEKEYIWVDRQPGIERWADVKRIMDQYGPSNRRIPNPIALHNNAQESITPTIREDDIPLVELNKQIFKAPPKVFMQPEQAPKPIENDISAMKKEIEELKNLVKALTGEEQKRGPGRPRKE